jgi:hypothetical protein
LTERAGRGYRAQRGEHQGVLPGLVRRIHPNERRADEQPGGTTRQPAQDSTPTDPPRWGATRRSPGPRRVRRDRLPAYREDVPGGTVIEQRLAVGRPGREVTA